MTQTLVEKILSQKVQRSVVPDEVMEFSVDCVMVHDANAPLFFKYFSADDAIYDPGKVVFVTDHFCPPSTPEHSGMVDNVRKFISDYRITKYHEFSGICHHLMVEEGYVVPGMLVVGIDSHATTYGAVGAFATGMGSTDTAYILKTGRTWLKVPGTIRVNFSGEPRPDVLGTDIALSLLEILGEDGASYRALEFGGFGVRNLGMDARMTVSNFSHEMGAKVGIFPVDDIASNYLHIRAKAEYDIFKPDEKAVYDRTLDIDLGEIAPKVALPHSPANVRQVSDAEGKAIDQAFIGSCASGRMEDLATAARILEGKKIHEDVRMIVIPVSNKIYAKALDAGLMAIFARAGAVICNPGCGPCAGIDKGILGEGEVCISTSNRNFKGRMGANSSEIYLASAATVAASALKGEITVPEIFEHETG
jgi:homoaconitate hydratase family protein